MNHGLLGEAVDEEHVELFTSIEGKARLAIRTNETIDLGRAAIDLDAAVLNRQRPAICGT